MSIHHAGESCGHVRCRLEWGCPGRPWRSVGAGAGTTRPTTRVTAQDAHRLLAAMAGRCTFTLSKRKRLELTLETET